MAHANSLGFGFRPNPGSIVSTQDDAVESPISVSVVSSPPIEVISPGAGNATWRGDVRVFSPNNQGESVAARTGEPDPLDEPLSPLSDDLLHVSFPIPPAQLFVSPPRVTPQEYGSQFESPPAGKKRRALLIGVRGTGDEQLLGCYNDVNDMKRLLTNTFHFEEREITILMDEDPTSKTFPTRDVMLDHMNTLVRDAMPGDSLFLHFSGHGGQIPDLDGDEADGLDEVIHCADGKIIVDDELHEILVKPLPKGCRLTAVFDCCASETGLDIVPSPHLTPNRTPEAFNGVLDLPNTFGSLLDPLQGSEECLPGTGLPAKGRKKQSDGDVVLWAACLDSGNSHEVVTASGARKGAMTQAFVQCLEKMPQQSYQHLLEAILMVFKTWGVPQTPQLSTAQKVNRGDMFTI